MGCALPSSARAANALAGLELHPAPRARERAGRRARAAHRPRRRADHDHARHRRRQPRRRRRRRGADDGGSEEQMAWDASALEALGVPVVQALCVTMSRERWEEGGEGLLPVDAATQVAIPEFDGRIIGGADLLQGARRRGLAGRRRRPALRPRPRALRPAGHASCSATPACATRTPARRIAIVLTAFPTKHARIGMAVGLDTPASAIGLLAPAGRRRRRRPRHPGRRRRAHARADRRRRPRPGVPHRRAAGRRAAADRGGRLPRLVRHARPEADRRDRGAVGPAARRPLPRRGRTSWSPAWSSATSSC